MTLYYVPVMPVKNRYPEEWYYQFPDEFRRHGVDFMQIPGKLFDTERMLDVPVTYKKRPHDMFTSLELGARWEINQIRNLICNLDNIKSDDVVFFTDIDFPGFCLPFVQLLKLKRPGVKVYGYLHAGSYCNGDIFYNTPGKLDAERATIKIMDGIFVGSEYHKRKIDCVVLGSDNIHVVGAPFYGWELGPHLPVKYDVVYTSRMDSQDEGRNFIEVVKACPDLRFVCTGEPPEELENLIHIPVRDREEYHAVLRRGRVYLSTAKECTFGYGAIEAVYAGLIPVAPRRFAFPEILDASAIYYDEFLEIPACIRKAIMLLEKDDTIIGTCRVHAKLDRWKESIPSMLRIMGLVG